MLVTNALTHPAPSFFESLFSESENQIQCLVKKPFLDQLGKGTLPTRVFAIYAQQDIGYIDSYAKAMDILVKKAPAEDRELLLTMQGEAVSEGGFLKEWLSSQGVCVDTHGESKHDSANQLYGAYIHRHVAHSFAQGCVALLPCMWVYFRVGDILLQNSQRGEDPSYENPYSFWINRYHGKSFSALVERTVGIAERAVQGAGLSFHTCRDIFLSGIELEDLFWQSCWDS